MRPQAHFRGTLVLRLSVLTALALGALYGCARLKSSPVAVTPPKAAPEEITVYPAEAPASVKLNDFRFNPPEVLEIRVKKLSSPAPGGNVVFMAHFAEDKRLGRQITLRPDGHTVVLHDDGKDGDEIAGDGVFSAIVPMDFSALAAQQTRVIADLEKRDKPIALRTFVGREVVKHETLDRAAVAALAGLRAGGIIKFIQIGGDTIDEKRSLLVTDKTVVEDPNRTFNPCTGVGTPMGKWTFGHLIQQMANEPLTGINPSDFALLWLKHWLHDQTVNSFTDLNRAAGMQALIDRWPKLADGRLDLAKAPMKLLAIVNRIDLANNLTYGNGSAGEGRFVFCVIDTTGGACSPMPFTVIFEYGIPKHTCSEITAWAKEWLNLGTLALGDPAYNSALEAITDQFAQANADPSKPNGSALNQLRTDEIALASPWELREFRIFSSDSDAGQLRQVTVKQTPDRTAYNKGGPHEADLAKWINDNTPAIVLDKHTVPAVLPFPSLDPFLGGFAPNGFDFWDAAGINNPDARFHLSLNTCNACHGRETDTSFTHVHPAPFGSEAGLSSFLIGDGAGGESDVIDPVVPATHHHFNDLARRAQVLHDLANQNCLFHIKFHPPLMTH